MKIPSYARYDYCNKKACEFLKEYNITSFPIDVERIIYQSGWGLTTYSELMKKFSCDLQKVITCLGSRDGYTQYDGFNYSIAYNDSEQLGNRKRFTLMHEIGHIYLAHLTDFEATSLFRGSLTNNENKVLENEANAFARNVLVPTTLLENLKDKSIYNISKRFGITLGAAQTRLNLYQKDSILNTYTGVMPHLKRVLYNFYYKKKCLTCGYSIVKKDILYCPICGNDSLKWGDGTMKYPIKIFLDENSKAIKCPVCDNEDIPTEGEFCQICGTNLVNRCTNNGNSYDSCGALAAGNARYCIYCGARTTFFESNLLSAWDKKLEENMILPFHESNNEIPGTPFIDDELPFS